MEVVHFQTDTLFAKLTLATFFSLAASAGSPSTVEPSNGPVHFHCLEQSGNMQQMLEYLRGKSDLCDVTLVVGEREFPAHRVVLAASSPYFRAMFTNEHLESKQNRIILNCIEEHSMQVLLDFVYTSELEISEENVQSLLAGASLLQLIPVVEACCDFFRVRLDPENCLGIAAFADMHGCNNLRDISLSFAREHFKETSHSDEFLAAPVSTLRQLISSEDLHVQREEEVLDAVLQWFHHDELNREKEVPSLMQFVKLPLIPWKTIKKRLISDVRITSDPGTQELITRAKNFQKFPDHSVDAYSESVFNPFVPRKSVTNRMLVYVVGGETDPGRATVNMVEVYNPAKDSWRELAPMGTKRRGVGVAILNGLLYVVGGSDGVQALRSAECYDPRTNTWSSISDLNEERSSVAVAVVGDFLYAVGGYDGIMSCLRSVECYNPGTDTWTYIAEMNIARSMTAVGVLNERLYVIGGYDGASDLSSCEMYDPNSDSWVMIEEMHTIRCMAGVAVLDNLLYVIGGCQQSQSLNSMEVYNPEKGSWTLAADMTECRSGVGAAVVGKRLYAVGGYSGLSYCRTVECYDPEKKGWSYVASPLTSRRRFGCCS